MKALVPPAPSAAERIRLWGVVQGVGLRPCIVRLARTWRLRGAVRNRGGLVEIIALAPVTRRDGFVCALTASMPTAAKVIRQTREPISAARTPARTPGHLVRQSSPRPDAVNRSPGFRILASDPLPGLVFPSPDLPVCVDCLADLDQLENRRFRHPLISCMSCGPRFSIIQAIPYDRERTSLADFPLCDHCRCEYESASNRRFHAQTISCHDCGPQLSWLPLPGAIGSWDNDGEAALDAAIRAIREEKAVAIKGIGGYHLACAAKSVRAVALLRGLKDRERKPFAVMYADLAALAAHAAVTPAEARELVADARPIVLVRRRPVDSCDLSGWPNALAPDVCARSIRIGAFLPYTPVQALLTRACGPLVMTSANPSDQPIIFRDTDMLTFATSRPGLAGILAHNRPILRGLDDSVIRLVGERMLFIRRSRGHVPLAIDLGPDQPEMQGQPDPRYPQVQTDSVAAPEQIRREPVILAVGGDLKATFAVASDGLAWLSSPVGDLESQSVYERWLAEQRDFCRLLQLDPDVLVTDRHPGYISAQLNASPVFSQRPQIRQAYQHHLAHAASVLAEHRLAGPALALAFDGTGFGDDGSVWGGEGLLLEESGGYRLGGLRPTRLPGGDAGMKEAWRALLGYLLAAGLDPAGDDLADVFSGPSSAERDWLAAAWRQGIGCAPNSSVGRLFDAVCALLGLSDRNHYEGECGSLLEDSAQLAADSGEMPWPLHFELVRDSETCLLVASPDPLWRGILQAKRQGVANGRLALGFHDALVAAARELCCRWAGETGVHTVVCSGGVFQNALLSERIAQALTDDGFTVYWNEKVPPNDGGICLGQVWLARRALRTGR